VKDAKAAEEEAPAPAKKPRSQQVEHRRISGQFGDLYESVHEAIEKQLAANDVALADLTEDMVARISYAAASLDVARKHGWKCTIPAMVQKAEFIMDVSILDDVEKAMHECPDPAKLDPTCAKGWFDSFVTTGWVSVDEPMNEMPVGVG